MDAEVVRDAIDGMTPEAKGLIRKLLEQPKPMWWVTLFRLAVSTPTEARYLIEQVYQTNKRHGMWVPGWVHAGRNCKNDADIVPYAIAEALDPGNELEAAKMQGWVK